MLALKPTALQTESLIENIIAARKCINGSSVAEKALEHVMTAIRVESL